jgi:cytochrome c553
MAITQWSIQAPSSKKSPRLGGAAALRKSYMFRQLYDFRHGARTGEWSPLMVQVVATLDEQDLLAIVAYLASRDP